MEGLYPEDIIYHVVNVLVLFILLRLILWRPVSRFLEERRDFIARELDGAAAARAEAEAMKSEYETQAAQFEEQGREILRDAQIRAGEHAAAFIASAREKAEQLTAEARVRIDDERRSALAAAQRDVAAMASEMAAQILRREVCAADDVSAANEFFAQLRPEAEA
jgi:F-type H+-transporting ATPase subunit b